MNIGETIVLNHPPVLSPHEIIFFYHMFLQPLRDGSRACLSVPIGGILLVRQAVIGRERTADNGWLEAAVEWEVKE
jgi:hypothetical protein